MPSCLVNDNPSGALRKIIIIEEQWLQLPTKGLEKRNKAREATRSSLPASAKCSNDHPQQASAVATSNMNNFQLPQPDALVSLDFQSRKGSVLAEWRNDLQMYSSG